MAKEKPQKQPVGPVTLPATKREAPPRKSAKKKPVPKKTNANPKYSGKKELAKLLFTKNDLTIEQIAERVGATAKTVGGWIKDNNWENFKKSLITTKDEQLLFFYDQLSSLNNLIKQRPEGRRFADTKEADVFAKLTATIKNLETETGIGDIITVAKLLIDSIPETERDFITQVTKYFDALIKEKLKRR
jgi:hypothetical protein